LLLNDGGDILVDSVSELMLHDALNFPAYYLTYLLLYCPRHFLPNSTRDFMLNGNLQPLLHGVAQLFRYGLFDLFYIRFVGDSLLNKHKALVNGLAHDGEGL
jgi:hypothetical protein